MLSILPRGGWESFFYCKKNCFNNTALGHRTTFDNVSPASEGMSSDRITKAIIRKPAPGIENVPRAIILLIIIQMNSRASARMVLLHRVCVCVREREPTSGNFHLPWTSQAPEVISIIRTAETPSESWSGPAALNGIVDGPDGLREFVYTNMQNNRSPGTLLLMCELKLGTRKWGKF